MEDLSEPKLREYLVDALKILEQSLAWGREDFRPAYRVAAAQLRLLLCDTTRIHGRIADVSLAPRLIPDLRLHPARLAEGRLGFDRGLAPVPRLEWLGQALGPPLAGEQVWTLREVIRWVCDRDGGIHVDPHPASTPPYLGAWILAAGEYVLEELRDYQPGNTKLNQKG